MAAVREASPSFPFGSWAEPAAKRSLKVTCGRREGLSMTVKPSGAADAGAKVASAGSWESASG
jgi:hypothetical protein